MIETKISQCVQSGQGAICSRRLLKFSSKPKTTDRDGWKTLEQDLIAHEGHGV